MDTRRNRKYTEQFKLEALELFKRSGRSSSEIERELGITRGLLLKWRTRYQILENEKQEVRLGPSDFEGAKAEIRHLQRRLAEVEEEKEILKKAVAIFSRISG